MIKLLLFVLLFLPIGLLAQRDFLVVIEGRATSFIEHKELYGVSVDLMQQESVLTKVLSDQDGQFYISAKITQGQSIQLRLTKGGYLTKYILLDLTTMQGQRNQPNGLQLLRNLKCELYELKPDVDLLFAKNQITDKYVWNAGTLEQLPLVKSDADAKASAAYQLAIDQKSIARLQQKATQKLAANQPQEAILYLDSILNINPDDARANEQKKQIIIQKEANIKREQDEAKFALLFEEATAAKLSGDLNLAESKYRSADAIIPNQPKVNAALQEISQIRSEAADAQSKTQAFQKAMQAATALMNAKKLDEAEAKLKEAQQIKPTERETVSLQLSQIKDIRFDIQLEAELKKTLKLANDQYLQKKYDLALETYKKADKQIALFHKQSLIDSYSKELQAGMKRVTEGINSMSQVYQNQLAKANENFNKGPQFYGTAKSILNSDPMKSRQNEPDVIALKEKIAAMEAYFAARKSAYQLVKAKDNPAALKALEKLYLTAEAQQQYLTNSEVLSIQKSADSIRSILTPATPTIVKEDVFVEPAGIRLSAPGETVNGESSMAFNDLKLTREAKQEAPYRTQQQIRTEVEYRNYFSQQNAQVGSFETTTQLELTRAQRQLNAQQQTNTQEILQVNQAQQLQAHEVSVNNRALATEARQQENSSNLTAWKDSKDQLTQLEKQEADARQQSELDRLNRIRNEKELQLQEQAIVAEKVVTELDERKQKVDFVKQEQQESATNGGQNQYEQIQKTASSTLQLKTTPNYLRDENGVLFAPNTLTEKTYQLKNKEGYITKVIVRRVVVDPNGHGVVYEQTTDENGKTYFTRDGQVSTEYIWFNESTGANVLIK